MSELQAIKRRYGIMGNDSGLNRALEIALQVALTNMSVLVTGESGVGKEVFSKIIHDNSPRKHNKYIAVNCGAIPEGTIESELFGHLKCAFTSADRDRKGYFAEADKGTIFLDEVGELPLAMQAKLLRVLESGEFLPVGSSKTQKVDVRIVAATNVNLLQAIERGRFREDLYYRLSQVSIFVPSLRSRKDDIYLLFRLFASKIADEYKMPKISLTPDAQEYLTNYTWKGNIRQLKNITEQMSIIEADKTITLQTLKQYIPPMPSLPVVVDSFNAEQGFSSQKELVMAIFQNKQEIAILKNELNGIKEYIQHILQAENSSPIIISQSNKEPVIYQKPQGINEQEEKENIEELEYSEAKDEKPLKLEEMEKKMILSALQRSRGKRSMAAKELGISERTLYRKINEYNISF